MRAGFVLTGEAVSEGLAEDFIFFAGLGASGASDALRFTVRK